MSIADIIIILLVLGLAIWGLVKYFSKNDSEDDDEDPDNPREWKD